MSPALEGVRILDMTQYEAGTSCTQHLGWLGADVVKIEAPTGDPGRYTGLGMGQLPGDPQYFLNYNANKRSVVLDLKSDRGRQLFLDLVPHFDAFVENYAPGAIERLDIGYERLRELNPKIVYGRLKGFGLSGPYKDYKSFDWVAQASAGTFSTTGEPDGPPTRPGPTMADSGTGVQMALAILAAYIEAQRTGQGQLIELSMQEAVTMFMRTLGLMNWASSRRRAPGFGREAGRPRRIAARATDRTTGSLSCPPPRACGTRSALRPESRNCCRMSVTPRGRRASSAAKRCTN